MCGCYQCLLLLFLAAALVWLMQLLVADAAAADGQPIGLPGCPTSCGGVSVPYPFGIQPGCHLEGSPATRATCRRARLFALVDVPVMEISIDDSTVRLLHGEGVLRTSTMWWDLLAGGQKVSMSPGSLLFAAQQQMQWKLVSSVLQGPNETRDGNATCPHDLGADACHSSYSTCQASFQAYSSFNFTGYACKCHEGYQGNPYLSNGCQGK
ncbi:wall-associated receptor kinase 4-like [Miscanthus floridulus]|uniref:wall-associated receptor kinase 4-like n=1 Tax=Miscanthus floridulus TaxID=154761 RepID=UPI003459A5C7